MYASEMPLQDPTITHQLFQMIAEMSDDEKRTLLKFLKGGALKNKCRRQHFRKPINIPVRYTSKVGLSNGFINNISLGGACILSRGAFSVGQSLSISLTPPNPAKTVWIAADVVRLTQEGIAVRFRSMNPIQKAAVISVASAM